jgi:hypothetical protein
MEQAFAYLVPSDPDEPENGMWATLVRRERVHVGDRLALSRTTTTPEGISVDPTDVEWEVVAVEATENDGRPAAVRGHRGPTPIWAGRLVLRPA